MNFRERYHQLKALAILMQQNNYLIWLLQSRQKELQNIIAINNPVLARSHKVISEKMETMRAEQMECIKALNLVNAALNEALTEKNVLWQQFIEMT